MTIRSFLRFDRSALSAVFLVLPILAGAAEMQRSTIPIKPEVDQPVCLKREYSESHMRENRKQLLSSMHILLTKETKSDNGETFTLNRVEVYGEKAGELFVNREAICDDQSDGTTLCFVECDGGAFSVLPKKESALFLVEYQSLFPLYKSGYTRQTATQKQTVLLRSGDRENYVYRLYPAPVSECKAVQERAIKIKSEC